MAGQSFLPLPPAAFHILVALAGGEQHGYAIMQMVERDTAGAVALGPGTLYGTLKRLLDSGLIEESGEREDGRNERRRYYRISRLGRAVATAEAGRLATAVKLARAANLLSVRAT